jgi:hypothetical protein
MGGGHSLTVYFSEGAIWLAHHKYFLNMGGTPPQHRSFTYASLLEIEACFLHASLAECWYMVSWVSLCDQYTISKKCFQHANIELCVVKLLKMEMILWKKWYSHFYYFGIVSFKEQMKIY